MLRGLTRLTLVTNTLMASNTGTTLPGGYRNSLGGPADEWYAQTNGTAYVSTAEACAAVPQAFRRNRTVIVAGVGEMWWLEADLSDNGLVVKVGSGAPGGGGGYSTDPFEYKVTAPGEITIQLPPGTTGIDYPVQKQTPNPGENGEPATTGETTPINIGHTSFSAATGIITISADASLVPGQIITGIRQYGGGQGGGPVNASDIVGVLDADQLPTADDAYIAQLFEALKPYLDQRYTQL